MTSPSRLGWAPSPRPVRARRGAAGFSLVELMLAMAIMAILLVLTVPVLDAISTSNTFVNGTYSNANQLLPVSTHFQQLIRSAVQPFPFTAAGVPTPPFGQYNSAGTLQANTLTANSLTFYSNVGNRYGPAMITSCFESAPPAVPQNASGCATAPTSTFVVTEALPLQNTCPISTNANYTQPNSPPTCSWGSARALLTVTDLDQGGNPVFSYATLQTSTAVPFGGGAPTTSTLWNTTPTFASFGSCLASPPVVTGSGNSQITTLSPLANCPAAEIGEVTIDLRINTSSKGMVKPAEDSSTVYLFSPTSSAYSLLVG